MLAVLQYPIWPELLRAAPLIVACLIGVVLALVNWRKSPRAAPLVLIAAALIGTTLVVRPVAFAVLVSSMGQRGLSPDQLMWVMNGIGFAAASVHAAALFLLFLAAFGGRPRAE